MKAVVVGIGSCFGDDAVGPAVARALAAGPALPLPARVVALERADLALLEALRGVELAVIVDALEADAAPGRVRRLRREELEAQRRPTSSHALGVAGVLALAEALGVLPRCIEIIGIELAECRDLDGGLSAQVSRAVPAACDLIRELLSEAAGRQGAISTIVSGSTRSTRKSRSGSESATQP